MKIKPGVSIVDCSAEILRGAILIESLFVSRGTSLVITSGVERYKHSAERSAHYRGDAIDVRSRDIPKEEQKPLLKAIKRKLGPHYVVILESTHYHLHWSPIYE